MTNTDNGKWEEMVARAAHTMDGYDWPDKVARAEAALQAAGVKKLVEAASEANNLYQSTGALLEHHARDCLVMRRLNAALSDNGRG